MRAVARRQLPLRPAGSDTVAALLDWYDAERRDLAWRTRRGRRVDAYKVWLSEIMLQQTTVKAVIPFYERFLARWPDRGALADCAPRRRSPCGPASATTRARAICMRARSGGGIRRRVPGRRGSLRKLPGVGPYTAAAISAIAFNRRAAPVDGNIERVITRAFAIEEPLPEAKGRLRRSPKTLCRAIARAITPRR